MEQFKTIIPSYMKRFIESLERTDLALLDQIARIIARTKKTGARIYTAGNGGSASTASHFCNDLIKGCRIDGRTGFSAQCLCDPMPVMTCLSNDFSYDDVFSIMLQTLGRRGDILLLFSGSGNSGNILQAAKAAKEIGLYVIGFSGRDGGAMKNLCDLCLVAPTDSMEEIEDCHLVYCHSMIGRIRAELMDCWDIEFIRRPVSSFKSALFDFDGTVSLLREGWQQVMIPYFVEVLAAAAPDCDVAETERVVTDFVDLLTGKQTIFQCIRLDEEVQKRGGAAVDPYLYKAEYLKRLMERIQGRLDALRSGSDDPEVYLSPGCKVFLHALRESGLKLYLASGTDEKDVLEEARLLGVDMLFDGIYGARDEVKDCAKELVIKRILEENQIKGNELIAFGDGYVEIELVKAVGGYAVAVATDEVRKKGVNPWKRERLLSAGADAVIPDFADPERLMSYFAVTGGLPSAPTI